MDIVPKNHDKNQLPLNQVLVGHCLEVLKGLPDKSVHCCVTSIPYWSLRDYQIPPVYWPAVSFSPMPGLPEICVPEQKASMGLEPDIWAFVGHTVSVFREVWRVLRDDGTLWLNIGDTYITSPPGNKGKFNSVGDGAYQRRQTRQLGHGEDMQAIYQKPKELKMKDLAGIPWRVAYALQADGWYLRSDVIWHKSNPMPESIQDRPTKGHEYVFLMSKSEKYFYDADAIREPVAREWDPENNGVYTHQNGELDGKILGRATMPHSGLKNSHPNPAGRNRRTVWTVSTAPYKSAHFACVDQETECLTNEGWKKYNELKPGMVAAQFDLESDLLSWGSIKEVAVYEVDDQDMIVAECRNAKMVLTPNHRTIISRRNPTTRHWQPYDVIRADALKTQHAVPISANWQGEWESPVSEEWAELFGWYITEGNETGHAWKVEIYQSYSANPQKVDRIEYLLNQVGAMYKKATFLRMYNNQETWQVAFQIEGFAAAYFREWCPGKQFPGGLLSWSSELLKALLRGLIDGDGSRREDGRFSYIQKSGDNASMVQAIGTRLGYATKLSWRSGETSVVYFTEKRRISFRGTAGEGAKVGTEKYTGIVWCPKLPKGTWVARRNGRMFITGNTFPPKLIEPMILASTSEVGCCPECGNPHIRVIDKEANYTKRQDRGQPNGKPPQVDSSGWEPATIKSVEWQPTCNHEHDPIPAIVLDPFMGSGTTGQVAIANRRNFIGIDANPVYATELVTERLNGTQIKLMEVAA